MNPILRILLGICVGGLGFSMVYYTDAYLRAIGPLAWAEKNLGGGGSRFMYKILGIGIIFLGIILITDLWDQIIGGFIQSIFGA